MITPAYAPTATERVLPRLALDFTTGVLDPRVTVTRALNTATRVNSSGSVEIVNSNLPRFDYDPVTLAPKGLLIEETRANILRYSEQIDNVWWTPARATVVADATTSPNGTANADKLVEDTSNNTHVVFVYPGTPGGTSTLSVYAKPAGRDWVVLETDAANTRSFFNVATGALGTIGSAVTATITAAGNGWYRCTITGSLSGGIYFATASANNVASYTGDGTSGIFIWGAQLEAGAFATSYIPTTTTSLTRNADVVTMTGTNFSSWYNASEGAFVVRHTGGSVGSYAFSNNDGTSNSYQGVVLHNATTLRSVLITGGNYQFVANTVTSVASANKTSFSYKTNSVAAASNAGTVATNNSITLPTVNRMFIGSFGSFGFLNGCVSMLNYYPQRLINAENQAFSK